MQQANADGTALRIINAHLNAVPNACENLDLASQPSSNESVDQRITGFSGIFYTALGVFAAGWLTLALEWLIFQCVRTPPPRQAHARASVVPLAAPSLCACARPPVRVCAGTAVAAPSGPS